ERVPDLLLAWVRRLPQQADRRHDEARRAVAALQTVLSVERLLHGMERAIRRKPLDCRDLVPVGLDAEQRARLDRLAVQQDRPCTARGRAATNIRPRQSEPLAQDVDQQLARLELQRVLAAVDRDRDAPHSASFRPWKLCASILHLRANGGGRARWGWGPRGGPPAPPASPRLSPRP